MKGEGGRKEGREGQVLTQVIFTCLNIAHNNVRRAWYLFSREHDVIES